MLLSVTGNMISRTWMTLIIPKLSGVSLFSTCMMLIISPFVYLPSRRLSVTVLALFFGMRISLMIIKRWCMIIILRVLIISVILLLLLMHSVSDVSIIMTIISILDIRWYILSWHALLIIIVIYWRKLRDYITFMSLLR